MIDDERINAATSHIVSEFTTVVMDKMRDEMCRRFDIDGTQWNVAVARAGMGITAMAVMANCGRPMDAAADLADKIEELVDRETGIN